MPLICRKIDSLPKLAWLAELQSGLAAITVYHGAWVEVSSAEFFEGAWNGAYDARRFDTATTFLGSGAREVAGGILFCTPIHLFERLYTVIHAGSRLISNSLIFLLEHSNDGFDLGYPNTYFDLLDYDRQGYYKTDKTLHTRNGATVALLEHGNFLIDAQLTVQRSDKVQEPVPENYSDYKRTLMATLDTLLTNAADPRRVQTFRPIASASRGYDSTAITALARELGGTEAITFATSDGNLLADDGSDIALALGLTVERYDRMGYKKLAQPAEPEFCVCPTGTTIPIASAEAQLRGGIYMTGRYADLAWAMDEKDMLPYLLWPTLFNRSGSTYEEFRLRVGFLHLPVPGIMIAHSRQLYEISNSAEMRPWSLNSDYNKPIPRRIAEEGGVPRDQFGMVKMASAHSILFEQHTFHPDSWTSFNTFLTEHPEINATLQAQTAPLLKQWHRVKKGAVRTARKRLPYNLYLRTVLLPNALTHRANSPLWGSRFLYTLHWGFEQIRDRYQFDHTKP
ncbi:MAG: hypothetical protein M9918_05340 [Anaerolineae bacterium]|nr:hypothetical protein [Anaerolineae bacterium]